MVPRRTPVQRMAPYVLSLPVYAFAVWLLWRPIINAWLSGESLSNVIKNWYLGDQLTYLSIAKNVQEGASAYIEPFTETSWSIYPSAYYWVLGLFARATDTNVFYAWNMVGMMSTIALAVAAGAAAVCVSGKRRMFILGPIALILGNLLHWSNDSWRAMFGEQAVLWPPLGILFNPGAETLGLALALLAIALIVKSFAGSPRLNWRYLTGAGAAIGVGLNFHTYTTLYAATIGVFVLLVWHLLTSPTKKRLLVTFLCIAVASAAVLAGVTTNALVLLGVLLVGAVAPLLIVNHWRSSSWRAFIGFVVAGAAAASPIALRIIADVRRPDSFLAYRSANAQTHTLSLPVGETALQTLPLLALAAVTLISLFRQRSDPKLAAWCAALGGACAASILLIFNQAWGMNQAPYRFYPYSCVVVAALSLPWLFFKLSNTPRVVLIRILLVGLLLATIPTTVSFAQDTSSLTTTVTDREIETYQRIGAALPNGLVLLDSCIPKRTFKIASGTETLDYNAGLALPDRLAAVQKVMYGQTHGVVVSNSDLAAAGVTSFVLATHCRQLDFRAIEQRFGEPILETTVPSEEDCLEAPRYRVYTVNPNRAPNLETPIKDFDLDNPQAPRITPSKACGLGAPF